MVLVLAWAALAAANPYLEQGRADFKALEFERSLGPLGLATEVKEQTSAERHESYDLLAQSLLALGRTREAEETYQRLLAQEPMAPEPRASPKVAAAFLAAKERLYPRPSVTLRRQPAPPERLLVEVRDPWAMVHHLIVRSGEQEQRLPAPADHLLNTALPEGATALVALSQKEALLAELTLDAAAGVAGRATGLTPAGEVRAAPSHRLPWLKWVLGAVAVGAAAAAGLLLFDAFLPRPVPPGITARSATLANADARAKAAAGWSFLGLTGAAAVGTLVVANLD
ncbi:MAG: hypothetical protein K1X89_08345 [Myxococcaceae bacterium]|nr:hypothetical protein [Myxococcaceae bacterium]